MTLPQVQVRHEKLLRKLRGDKTSFRCAQMRLVGATCYYGITLTNTFVLFGTLKEKNSIS